jgi:hypothetical protein
VKRIVFGMIWFVVIWFGGLVLGGSIAGAIAGSQVKATNITDGYAKGQQVGQVAGAEFGQKYGVAIFIGALVLSIGGTAIGLLPGTKKKQPK